MDIVEDKEDRDAHMDVEGYKSHVKEPQYDCGCGCNGHTRSPFLIFLINCNPSENQKSDSH